MKKLLVILITTFFLSNGINAQVKRNVDPAQKMQRMHGDKSHSKMKNNYSNLNLSQDQKGKLKGVLQDSKQQREAIKNDASLSDVQRGAKMKQLKEDQKQKVNEILTPEQRNQAKENRKDRKDNKDGQVKAGKKEMASLGLSQAQKDQMKSYKEDRKQQSMAIKNDASLTPEQKKAKLKVLKADSFSKMQKVLTPEQKEKVKMYKDQKKDKK